MTDSVCANGFVSQGRGCVLCVCECVKNVCVFGCLLFIPVAFDQF